MAHINELIDFVVAAYIVHENKVLLINHKQLRKWFPIGGHIELNEDPEEALVREIKEECGLEVEIVGMKKVLDEAGTKPLIPPLYLDIHDITSSHRHVGLIYFASSQSSNVTLAESEHTDIRWFAKEELSDPQYAIGKYVQYYAERALEHFLAK